jgi:hypothetical protein
MDKRNSVNIGENVSGSVDSEAVAESVSFSLDIDGQRQKAQLDLYNAQIKKYKLRSDRYQWNTFLRIGFSIIYTVFLFVWLNKVIHIVTHNKICGYSLSDSVLITLLATTTANVFGMVIIVLKNLFPEKNKKEKPAEK